MNRPTCAVRIRPTMLCEPAAWMIVCATLVFASGCAAPPGIDAWQKSVENYLAQNNSEQMALMEMTLPDSGDPPRRGFALLGEPDPARSTDAQGVLIGRRRIGSKDYLIYLVGLNQQRHVRDIRVAAFSPAGGQRRWQLGREDNEALKKYLSVGEKLAKLRFPGRRELPPEYLTFPRLADRFDLAVNGSEIAVTHPASGAQWDLKLPDAVSEVALRP